MSFYSCVKTQTKIILFNIMSLEGVKKCQDFFESASDKNSYKQIEETKLKELEQIQKLCREENFSSSNL